jgi:hypothetical protein
MLGLNITEEIVQTPLAMDLPLWDVSMKAKSWLPIMPVPLPRIPRMAKRASLLAFLGRKLDATTLRTPLQKISHWTLQQALLISVTAA